MTIPVLSCVSLAWGTGGSLYVLFGVREHVPAAVRLSPILWQ